MKDVAVIMDLHELAPVGRRPAGGSKGRRFERFAEMRRMFLVVAGSVMNSVGRMSITGKA